MMIRKTVQSQFVKDSISPRACRICRDGEDIRENLVIRNTVLKRLLESKTTMTEKRTIAQFSFIVQCLSRIS
jgi:hypothetical protein